MQPSQTFHQAVLWPFARVNCRPRLLESKVVSFASRNKLAGVFPRIFVWAGAAALCALVLKALSGADDFWRALRGVLDKGFPEAGDFSV
jgi:hypothetical protein